MNDKASQSKKNHHSTSVNSLLVGLIATTLYFNTKSNDPFNTHKLIVVLLLSSWLLSKILAHYRRNTLKKFSIDSLVISILVIFLFLQVVSLAKSDSFVVGFIGDTQRRNGFLSYLALSIILLYTFIYFNFFHSIQFIKISLLIGLILVAYGTLQVTGRDFVAWVNPHNSMIGTVGNPNFASSLLAIIFLLASSVFFLKSITTVYKVASILVIVLAPWLIYRSNSRQGLIVIGIGLLMFVSLYSVSNFRKLRFVIPTISFIILIVAILGMLQTGPLAYFLYKDSVSVRGFYWQAALNMVGNYPWAGVGLDNYGSYFKEFRDAQYPLKYGYEITSSNAHNTFLQLFATGGILLGLAYCSIIVLIVIVGLKGIKQASGDQRTLSIVLFSVWTGYQSQSIISIDNIGIAIWGWILGGAILALNRNGIDKNLSKENHTKKQAPELFQTFISIACIIPCLFISILLHRQEADLFVAKTALMQNPVNQNLASLNAQKVLDNKLSDPYYRYEAALILNQLGKTDLAESLVDQILSENPRNLVMLNWVVQKEVRKGNYNDALIRTKQIEMYDPWNVKNLLSMGELYKFLGQNSAMEDIRLKINKIAPNTEVSQVANQILK